MIYLHGCLFMGKRLLLEFHGVVVCKCSFVSLGEVPFRGLLSSTSFSFLTDVNTLGDHCHLLLDIIIHPLGLYQGSNHLTECDDAK